MGIKEWIIPQEKKFFDMSNQQAAKIREGVLLLYELLNNFKDIEQKRAKLKAIEHEADNIVHCIFNRLNKVFITPIDREDISQLTSRLDDIMDRTYAVANRIYLYNIKAPTQPMKEFSQCLVNAMDHIVHAVYRLRYLKNTKEMVSFCVEIHRIENQADEILNNAVSQLFKENNPIKIIQLKEIYEHLEVATDKCEDVANVISNILIKHG